MFSNVEKILLAWKLELEVVINSFMTCACCIASICCFLSEHEKVCIKGKTKWLSYCWSLLLLVFIIMTRLILGNPVVKYSLNGHQIFQCD